MAKTKKTKGSAKDTAAQAIQYKVMNCNGQEVGTVDLDAGVFGAEINASLAHDAVVWQLNNRRAGTHSTLSKGVMRGGNRKPWRQKGTGRARAGSNTSPLWVGGAVAHGPKYHDHITRVSKRARRQAVCAVLSDKVQQQNLVVLDKLEVPSGKTKDMAKIINKLPVKGRLNLLFALKGKELASVPEYRASRNIVSVLPMSLDGVNAYDLLKNKYLVSTVAGIKSLEETLKARMA